MTQAEALAILKTGANVFLTGEPGSVKTHTVNQYVAYLRSCGIEPAITASTGIAATHIGGFTIHSWSGIGVRRALTPYDLDHIGQNRNIVRRVGNARILVIDEISMLSAATLNMVDAVCREIRRNQEPFGGLQVVLVGDFFQLPPISPREDSEKQELFNQDSNRASVHAKPGTGTQFAFLSAAWNALNPLICYLSEQHRQEDVVFLEFLSAVRRATVAEPHRQLLRTRYFSKPRDGITQLYSHNADVDEINGGELEKLSGETKTFDMESRGPEKLVFSLKRGCLSPEKLLIKIGARVIFTKNDSTMHRYVNGTLGHVIGFSKKDEFPVVKTNAGKTIVATPAEWRIDDGGRVLARITQVPLRLAWAMTVHKSQGMSLDAAHMDLSDAFEYGQGYVALSRVRALSGLSLAGLNTRALLVHPEVQAKDAEFREQSHNARQTFAKLHVLKLLAMHENFVRACGGKPGMGRRVAASKKAGSTYEATKVLILRKLSLKDMAKERNVTVGTIMSHLEKLVAEKKIDPLRDLAHFKQNPVRLEEMKKALESVFKKEKKILLAPAHELLGKRYSYDELRLARLFMIKIKN